MWDDFEQVMATSSRYLKDFKMDDCIPVAESMAITRVLHDGGSGKMNLPSGVAGGSYKATIPLIRPSKLTSKRRGGIGKDLSEGWCLNFAVGCTHGCPFCYVDAIHKRFGGRYGKQTRRRWGDYFLAPSNLQSAIERTPWERWRGKEVMMSSTHDPYLPALAGAAREILEHALPAGVRLCIQTRSTLAAKDFDMIAEYDGQVRLQVSIATMSRELSRKIEPRVPPPERRMRMLADAKRAGLRVGVIIAPVFPANRLRPDVGEDLAEIAASLAEIGPDHIYGESLHARGENIVLLDSVLGDQIRLTNGFDAGVGKLFRQELESAGLKGVWWPEHK
jgi:DNA repair photolyase